MLRFVPQSLRRFFRTPAGAAILSFVFPGLGQAAAGKPSRGAIVAIPALAVTGVFGLILLFERHTILDAAFNQQWLTSLLILDVVALIYHAWAVVDAYLLAAPVQAEPRRKNPAARKWGASFGIAIVVSGTVLVHAGLASEAMTWQNGLSCISSATGSCMFGDATLAPGQTIAMATDDPNVDVQVDPSGSPDGSLATPTDGTSSASPSFDSSATFDPASLPSFATPPNAQNWAADGQLNVLLAGIDAGSGGSRNSGLRPDTMIVLHVDLATGRAAMIGIPRNMQCVPLPQAIAAHYSNNTNGCPNYTYPNMLNWLANDAGWNHPGYFPFYQGKGLEYTRAMTATQEAIETLTGLTIDGYAVINLEGLVTIIDDVGGINITVPSNLTAYDGPCGAKGTWAAKIRVCSLNPPHGGYPIASPSVIPHMIADAAQSGGMQKITWQGNGGYDIGFVVSAGTQHMDGDWALAYARTRIYTTDYNRMLRQQLVLTSMRETLNPCSMLLNINKYINDVGTAFWTNLPLADGVTQWAGIAQNILGKNVKNITLDPGTLGTRSTYINATTWAKAKDIVAHSLDGVPAATGGGGGGAGGGGFHC
jgi:anionic cell wall polymer biosynthesis LytR-Cps2A-Psr (LCP) family protein/TM2 domain-containing membrane protein YozV